MKYRNPIIAKMENLEEGMYCGANFEVKGVAYGSKKSFGI